MGMGEMIWQQVQFIYHLWIPKGNTAVLMMPGTLVHVCIHTTCAALHFNLSVGLNQMAGGWTALLKRNS